MTGKEIAELQANAAIEERVIVSRPFREVGKLMEGRLELYFADGSSFSHPVVAGRITVDDANEGS